jgi:hypothetical protein
VAIEDLAAHGWLSTEGNILLVGVLRVDFRSDWRPESFGHQCHDRASPSGFPSLLAQ